jgi:ABC-2 type transport system ATP-binding protein
LINGGGSDRSGYAVTTHGLSKRYGRQLALDGVDLRVPDGAVYVLVGANGAGKSTLFKVLMNLERPDTGTAEVFGLDTGRSGPEVRAQIGYVPERQDAPHRAMTCARLLRHASTFYPDWDDAYANHLVRALAVQPERRVGGLSKGETRRVQLVLALAYRPPLLLLDEPTDGLDPVVRRRALALLAEHLADTQATVLVSTHHITELDSLADHIGVLCDGRLVAQMPRDDLQRSVKSYQLDVPDGWVAPAELHPSGLRRATVGRIVRCTLVGDEREVMERLVASGAVVRGVIPLSLEDSALAFLPEDPS